MALGADVVDNLNKFELKIVRLLLKGVPLSKDDLHKHFKDEKIISSAVSSLLNLDYIQHEEVPHKSVKGDSFMGISGRYIIKNKSACLDAVWKKRINTALTFIMVLGAICASASFIMDLFFRHAIP